MAKKGGNPQNFNNPPKTSIAPLSFRLTDKQIDEFVRSLPNRNEWLREVVSVAAQQKMAANNEQSV